MIGTVASSGCTPLGLLGIEYPDLDDSGMHQTRLGCIQAGHGYFLHIYVPCGPILPTQWPVHMHNCGAWPTCSPA